MRTSAWLIAGLVFGAAAYFFAAPDSLRPIALKSDYEQFCLACEESLKERLRSPSSYMRIKCQGPYSEAANEESYLDHDRSQAWSEVDSNVKSQIQAGELQITKSFIEYEAANGFGASIRGLSSCTVDHRKATTLPDAVRYFGPNIDGLSHTQWIISQIESN